MTRGSRPRWWVLAQAAVAFQVLAAPAWADGQSTTCTGFISSVPYTISAPGVYCLNQNLTTSITGGGAITVDANFVVVDLNGFRLTGLPAGPGTLAAGVYAVDRQNITVRNGTIRGFFWGVCLDDLSGSNSVSGGHLVEHVTAVDNTWVAIYLRGRGNAIRNNVIRNTTGTTFYGPDAETAGIITLGPGARVIGNDVMDTIGMGAYIGRAIRIVETAGAVVEGNRLTNSSTATPGMGVSIEYGSSDVLVMDNRIGVMIHGIHFFPGIPGKYGNNVATGTTYPYVGGTDLGNNY